MLLSTVIITKNCAHTLAACLTSVQAISDEIVILDANSTDHTVAVGRRYTDKITISAEWPGFGRQKQQALDLACGSWILSIDADEVLTSACQQAIREAITHNDSYDAYHLKRLMIFAGKVIYHSGCSDYPIRLFKKTCGKFTPDLVHESVIINGKVGRIHHPMLHYSYCNIAEWIKKMNLYSELGSRKKASNKNYSVSYAVLSGIIRFIKMYFFKLGFLDGRLGFVTSVNSAIANYYKYLKLALDKDFKLPADSNKEAIYDNMG